MLWHNCILCLGQSKAQDTFVPEGVRILCINDCCHSGTICDIDSFMYSHDIYSISAAKDDEEAEDVGAGGVLSCAMRRAVSTLSLEHGNQAGNGGLQQKSQKTLPLHILSHPHIIPWHLSYHAEWVSATKLQEFSILDTFKRCKTFAKQLTKEQHLTLQYNGTNPSLVAWPLGFPWWEYFRKAMLMGVNIQDLAEDGLESDDWTQIDGSPGTGQAGVGVPVPRASPFGLTPQAGLAAGPNFGTMWPHFFQQKAVKKQTPETKSTPAKLWSRIESSSASSTKDESRHHETESALLWPMTIFLNRTEFMDLDNFHSGTTGGCLTNFVIERIASTMTIRPPPCNRAKQQFNMIQFLHCILGKISILHCDVRLPEG